MSSNDESLSIYDVATRRLLGDPIPADAPVAWPGALRPAGGALAVTVAGGIEVWDLDRSGSPRRPATSSAAT